MSEENSGVIRRDVEAGREELLAFAGDLIRCPSPTGREEAVARVLADRMRRLGYDQVTIDRLGNVIGTIGSGPRSILFDSHMDTVDVIDGALWTVDPFGGTVRDGCLYGRGAVDMKGALAASVYAGATAKALGLLEGKRLYVVGSVMEEDYDGEAVDRLLEESGISPDAVVVCEATGLDIGRGHRGRALIQVTVRGRSAHASKPEMGVNPVYGLQRVIARTEELSHRLKGGPEGGSVAVTGISCVTASANSVPQSASLVLDRRLSMGEDLSFLTGEMAELLEGLDAQWQICNVPGVSWRKEAMTLHSYLPAWEIPEGSPLVAAAAAACRQTLGRDAACVKLGYSTNAVATAGRRQIPTIVLGPGDVAKAHMRDESCPVDQLLRAWEIYTRLCATF